jgi:hypothetical protein
LNSFSQLPAVKKDSKNGAARTFFGPSYFDPALTTELQKVLYLPLFYCKDWSQLHYLSDMNLFTINPILKIQ